MTDYRNQTALAAELTGRTALEHGHVIVTAESCTGGIVAGSLTEVPGSSAWFDRGFVTYATISKTDLLDVDPQEIERFGVVSEAVAKAMARGAIARSRATLAVALTGVAGPSGGTQETPVGTVCIGWAERTPEGDVLTCARTIRILGSRSAVRWGAARTALQGLIALMGGVNPAKMPCEFD